MIVWLTVRSPRPWQIVLKLWNKLWSWKRIWWWGTFLFCMMQKQFTSWSEFTFLIWHLIRSLALSNIQYVSRWIGLTLALMWIGHRGLSSRWKRYLLLFFGCNITRRLRRCNCLFGDALDCSTHLCRMLDMFVCYGQEIKMAEQRYSESSSSSSVSTMGVKLIKIIAAAMPINLIMKCSSIKH